MLVLGIETACDDTSVGIVEDGTSILANETWAQDSIHRDFGGVVPELAARAQARVLNIVIEEALKTANVRFGHLDAIGVNCKHGLLRSIMVGVSAAKALAYSLSRPLVGVHHIEGHIYSNILAHKDITFPHLCLAVAGGHTLLIHVLEPGRYMIVGRTLDDSAGEVLDKVARHLGLGFPGGRVIDELSKSGRDDAFSFPRPLLGQGFDFSFSGLKESARRKIESSRRANSELDLASFAASFQRAIVDILIAKTLDAAQKLDVAVISLVGGVAANTMLRARLEAQAGERGIRVFFPPVALCGDNGAMVAALAYYKLLRDGPATLALDAEASASLELE